MSKSFKVKQIQLNKCSYPIQRVRPLNRTWIIYDCFTHSSTTAITDLHLLALSPVRISPLKTRQ